MFSIDFVRAGEDNDCLTYQGGARAHRTQPLVQVKDRKLHRVIQMPNGFFIAKYSNFTDVWSGAFYAAQAVLPPDLVQYNVANGDEKKLDGLYDRGALFLGSNPSLQYVRPARTQRRDIFDDITGWLEDAFGTLVCNDFAVLGVGPFDAAAAIIESTNSGGVGLTDDQLFFAQAAMGYVPSGINVYYGANFAPGFDSAIGTTFLESIYLCSTGDTVDTTPATGLASDS
ncbi:hypothetical protein BGX26_006338, partial [Mortierella sp. AD094]